MTLNPKLLTSCGSLLILLQSSCALTSKADARTPRYFSVSERPQLGAVPAGVLTPLQLRLDQVTAAAHLDERISFRLSGTELGFYDERRWTELPEAYLRRALARDLFEQRGLQRVAMGGAPTLDVELTGFEELRGKPTKVRVTLNFNLHDERGSLLERSLELERVVAEQAGADPAQRLVAALSATLAEAVAQVGTQVVARLRSTKQDASPSSPP